MRIRFPSASLATLLLVACAPKATSLTPDHPASASAPIGRLAGPPPALRPGVAVTTEPPAADPVPSGHEHHLPAPSQDPPAETKEPTATEPKKAAPAKKTEPKKTEPKKPEPKKPEPKKPEPKQPEPKKPEPPAPDPHQGHDMSGHEHH